MLEFLVLGFLLVGAAHGHRYGADLQACDSMKPGHGTTVRQTMATPYKIETNMAGYVPCPTMPVPGQPIRCGVIVRVRARRTGNVFKGFLLQARSRLQNGQIMNVGEFRYMNGQQVTARNNANNVQQLNQMRMQQQMGGNPNAMGQMGFQGRKKRQVRPNFNQGGFNQNNQNNMNQRNMMQQGGNVIVQRLNCPRGFTVTHTENNPKGMVALVWYPPVGFNRPIQFVGTVVRDFNTYWMGHRSLTLPARRGLRAAQFAGQTGRWFSGANRATSGVLILMSSLFAMVYYFL